MKVVFVMGVSGSGKTTIAQTLQSLHCTNSIFIEGDLLHCAENISKMSSGLPLTDDDRMPWLERIKDTVMNKITNGYSLIIITCSLLKRKYREFLLGSFISDQCVQLMLIHLYGPFETIKQRMEGRSHYMKANMLQSQVDTLESPFEGELGDGCTFISFDVSKLGVDEVCSQMPNCPTCNKPVYFAEKVTALNKDWHRACLKCKRCRKTLTPGAFSEKEGIGYCTKPCYADLFGPKGYGFGGAADSHTYGST